jgi:hypothetical protein
VANTWGYGALTNSYNDIRNAKTIMIMGGIPPKRILYRCNTFWKVRGSPRQYDRD